MNNQFEQVKFKIPITANFNGSYDFVLNELVSSLRKPARGTHVACFVCGGMGMTLYKHEDKRICKRCKAKLTLEAEESEL